MTPEEVIAKLARGEYGTALWPAKHWTNTPRSRREIPKGTDPVKAYLLGYTAREIEENLGVDRNALFALMGRRKR